MAIKLILGIITILYVLLLARYGVTLAICAIIIISRLTKNTGIYKRIVSRELIIFVFLLNISCVEYVGNHMPGSPKDSTGFIHYIKIFLIITIVVNILCELINFLLDNYVAPIFNNEKI